MVSHSGQGQVSHEAADTDVLLDPSAFGLRTIVRPNDDRRPWRLIEAARNGIEVPGAMLLVARAGTLAEYAHAALPRLAPGLFLSESGDRSDWTKYQQPELAELFGGLWTKDPDAVGYLYAAPCKHSMTIAAERDGAELLEAPYQPTFLRNVVRSNVAHMKLPSEIFTQRRTWAYRDGESADDKHLDLCILRRDSLIRRDGRTSRVLTCAKLMGLANDGRSDLELLKRGTMPSMEGLHHGGVTNSPTIVAGLITGPFDGDGRVTPSASRDHHNFHLTLDRDSGVKRRVTWGSSGFGDLPRLDPHIGSMLWRDGLVVALAQHSR
jgi:hypothetical protein